MAFATVKLLGYAPDLPPDTPGAITAQQGMIPTPKGYTSGPTYQSGASNTSLGAPSIGVFSTRKNDGTRRFFVGTATKLWESNNSGSVLTDRSGTTYSASDPSQGWSFCQFGDVTLASNKGDAIQQIAGGSAFAAISGAPKAAIIVNAGPATAPFVLAFNYNDGTDHPNGLFNSGLADYTGWVVGTNQCATLQAYEPSGKFVAAIAYRDGAIAFKDNAMFEVTYSAVAATPGWAFRRIASDIGCCGKNMCVNVNDTIYFADKHGFWIYDGSYPKKLPGYVHDFWAQQVQQALIVDSCQMRWDAEKHNLWVSQTLQGTTNQGGQWYVWNQLSGLWSSQQFVGSPTTVPPIVVREIIDFNGQSSSTIPFPLTTNICTSTWPVAIYHYNDATLSATSVYSPPSMTLWRIGDPIGYTEVTRIAPVWIGANTPDTTSTCQLDGYKSQNGASVQTVGPTTIDSNSLYFDVRLSANWIKTTICAYGAYEFGAVGISSVPSGTRGTR